MSIRETKEYQEMTLWSMLRLTYNDPETEEESLAFWQKMVDTGMAWQFDGFTARTAAQMIEEGIIEPAS
jgi:hypothetical protein